MAEPTGPPVFIFLFLRMPEGICYGVATILLPFLITQAGLPVVSAAAVTSIAILPYVMAALCGPIIGLTLTVQRWFWNGLLASATGLILVGVVPVHASTLWTLTAATVFCETGAVIICVSVGSLIARAVPTSNIGRAGGWYQAGLLGGSGLGGGGGIWLVTHESRLIAAVTLAGLALLCGTFLRFVRTESVVPDGRLLKARLREFARDLLALVRSPQSCLVTVLVMSPVGIGAATNLWAAIASDWHASPNLVAFVTGVVNGLAAATGCLFGGWFADRAGRWTAFFGSGLMMAFVALLMSAAPRTGWVFGAGVLFYAYAQGWANAAFCALALFVVGRNSAPTKYAVLISLGNLPISYMTLFDGFAHDRWGTGGMLNAEALLGIVCVGLGLWALWHIRSQTYQILADGC
jgi:MFS transporter, PAT family, beta-lactamase induction signal transducer AmpG